MKGWWDWLYGLKRNFLRAVDQHDGDGPLTLAVYCRSGKHRSVGTALVLYHILRAEGWSCTDLKHLSEKQWSRACCKGRCAECQNPPTDVLDQTYEQAVRVWRTI